VNPLLFVRVDAAFLTARDDVLAVLFKGDRHAFNEWARTLEPGRVLRWCSGFARCPCSFSPLRFSSFLGAGGS